MNFLQYDVINSTSKGRKYEEKMYSIYVSLINVLNRDFVLQLVIL